MTETDANTRVMQYVQTTVWALFLRQDLQVVMRRVNQVAFSEHAKTHDIHVEFIPHPMGVEEARKAFEAGPRKPDTIYNYVAVKLRFPSKLNNYGNNPIEYVLYYLRGQANDLGLPEE